MTSNRNGSLFYFGERILLSCSGLETEPHSHYAVSILFSLTKPFEIILKDGGKEVHSGVLIPPNFYHTLIARDSEMIVLQLDPRSDDYSSLKANFSGEKAHSLSESYLEKLKPSCERLMTGDLDCKSAENLFYQILESLGGSRQRKEKTNMDSRMTKAADLIKTNLPHSIPVSRLAKEVDLSKDRLMHLFKENFGLPLRQYLLWLRLHEAAKMLQSGGNLTEASHAAGFSDQAHLSRTFKKMFGVQPSRFLGQGNKIKVCFCSPHS
ncbi:helix-turn-helix transcriptional regulator [Leptospira idonii]|uniref:AraC family transcriptional regulator n=1 Tax=Leptospira idonii TaxID=1193500 RepID=A0A4V3JXN1_9LEPT|nr:AraC family transcriptional regulator [Leptospira idonii]TGN18006.1 AraC family transcriptional regulator [Leptospira idonii]